MERIEIAANPNADAPVPCYLLHKTHVITDHILARMRLAKQQIVGWRCEYVILYWIDKPERTAHQTKDILHLKRLFDDRDDDRAQTVFVVDTVNTNRTFPGLFEFMFSLDLEWLSPQTWAWNMADVPELTWFDTMREKIRRDEQRLNDTVWVWMMEYDVGWKGDLGDILMGVFTNASKHRYLGFDYNGPKLAKWTHIDKRYNVPYAEDGIYNCLIQLIRYTPEMMQRMIEQAQFQNTCRKSVVRQSVNVAASHKMNMHRERVA